ncbi:golgin subfamily A member 6-like protein 22 [Brassica napus]|uniref:golgin subfamily A member 6-like protein 22 n=1 Tax=Brassica napus TaxID=3708 RepID=UPI0020787793|nr:golgin subfamily A member 6-like protein 22 [Brassica napus]
MCKSRFTKSSMKGYPLEDIYAALGHTKVINSVLVPTVGEEIMLARIIDEEREYHCEGSTSDTWNHWLNVKQKKIFWKELYDLDVAARVFKKKKDKEKVTFLEDSSSKSGLESLKALEEKILGAMSEGFSGLKSVVEAKLGDMDVRMSKFEKNQRQLKRRAKKIEEKLTSIESNKNEERNYGEDMDFGWDDRDYGRAEGKENSEKAKEDKENSESGEEKDVVSGGENSKDGEKDKGNVEEEEEKENEADKTELGTREKDEVSEEDYDTEEEAEKRRVEADALWKSILSEETEYLEKEAEKVAKGTPTPPRGRPKRLAARKIVLTPPEEFLRGPTVTSPSPIETEKEAETVIEEEGEEMAVEAEESDEERLKEKNAEEMVEEEEGVEESPTEKIAEEMVEEEEGVEESPTEKIAEEMVKEEEGVEESPTEKIAEEMVEKEEAVEESPTEKNAEEMVEEEAEDAEEAEEAMEAEEAEEAEEEADKVVEKEAETVVEKEGDKYTDEEKQMWALVVYKASEEMADGTTEVRRDGTNEVRTGFKLRCKQKIMMYGKPRGKKKPQRPQSQESAPVIARTPREKRKPQRLQSPYTQVKTEDIDGPKKKRKTKVK